MSLKQPIIINDKGNICKKCAKNHTCIYYAKYKKLLDMFENSGSGDYLIRMICYIKKCNQHIKED